MADRPILSKNYSIPMDMFASAFKDFQKKFVYPKNILMTSVFGLIAVLYTFPLAEDPKNSVCIMIIIVCLFMIGGMWLNPLMIRKKLLGSIEGIQNDRYIAELYSDRIDIGTVIEEDSENEEESQEKDLSDISADNDTDDSFFQEKNHDYDDKIARTVINFSAGNIKILEKSKYFIIYIIKRNFYIIPKESFTPEEIEILKNGFKNTKFTPENK